MSSALLLGCLALLVSGCCNDCPTLPDLPRTLFVAPDGDGQYPTIAAAIAAAGDGDIVALADGVYRGPGNRDLELLGKAITLTSISGRAEACTIDCEGTKKVFHRAFYFHDREDASTIVQDLTIINGSASYGGGGIFCEHESSPILRRLVVSHCWAAVFGGGLFVHSRSRATIEDCSFVGNVGDYGGGVSSFGAAPHVSRCIFAANEGLAGSLLVWDDNAGQASIEECLFRDNLGGAMFFWEVQSQVSDCRCENNQAHEGAAITCIYASPVFLRCTSLSDGDDDATVFGCCLFCIGGRPLFASCTFTHGRGYAGSSLVTLAEDCAPVFDRCIFSFCGCGPALNCDDPGCEPVLQCCDIFGNAGGDWTGCIADQAGLRGNFSADPLFCDPETGNLYLQTTSPCRPSATDCGLVGALPVGCM